MTRVGAPAGLPLGNFLALGAGEMAARSVVFFATGHTFHRWVGQLRIHGDASYQAREMTSPKNGNSETDGDQAPATVCCR